MANTFLLAKGFKIGKSLCERSMINTANNILLNAEKNYFSAQRDLIAAKYDYIISTLELKLASGILSPADIYEISGYLDS